MFRLLKFLVPQDQKTSNSKKTGGLNENSTRQPINMSKLSRRKKHYKSYDALQGKIHIFEKEGIVIKEIDRSLVHLHRSRDHLPVRENFVHERKLHIKLSSLASPPPPPNTTCTNTDTIEQNNGNTVAVKNNGSPHITHVISSWDDKKYYYLAMEYCQQDLFAYVVQYHKGMQNKRQPDNLRTNNKNTMMREDETIPLYEDMRFLFFQLVNGLRWLHSQNVCHLDISLENVLLKCYRKPKGIENNSSGSDDDSLLNDTSISFSSQISFNSQDNNDNGDNDGFGVIDGYDLKDESYSGDDIMMIHEECKEDYEEPDELLVTKFIDFGVSKQYYPKHKNEKLVERCSKLGKTSYRALEVEFATHDSPYDPKSADIYSLGIVLFSMLTGISLYQSLYDKQAKLVLKEGGHGIEKILKKYKRLHLMTPMALDLISRMVTEESKRITMDEIIIHPFVNWNKNSRKFNRLYTKYSKGDQVSNNNNPNDKIKLEPFRCSCPIAAMEARHQQIELITMPLRINK